MPLPILFIGIAAATGSAGAGMAVKAGFDQFHAKQLNEQAEQSIKLACEWLERSRGECSTALKSLGEEKTDVLSSTIPKFLKSFRRLKNVDLSDSKGLREISKLHIDKQDFDELEDMSNFVVSLGQGMVTGAASGALVAFGAYSAAGTLATASTGTAISALSGIAAQNATLAFFGGGSLVAGGLGMAGGTAVLGGLVAGPALLVFGLVVGAKAGKNLELAKANAAKVDVAREQLEAGIDECCEIRRRAYMFYSLLAQFDSHLRAEVCKLESVIRDEGIDYRSFSPKAKVVVAKSASLAKTVKAILDTAILEEDGSLTEDSAVIAKDLRKMLRESDGES